MRKCGKQPDTWGNPNLQNTRKTSEIQTAETHEIENPRALAQNRKTTKRPNDTQHTQRKTSERHDGNAKIKLIQEKLTLIRQRCAQQQQQTRISKPNRKEENCTKMGTERRNDDEGATKPYQKRQRNRRGHHKTPQDRQNDRRNRNAPGK